MENISAKERTLPEIPSAELEHIIFLKNLPDEFSREYELKLTDYANSYTQSEIGILEKLIRDFNTEFNRKIRKEESTEKINRRGGIRRGKNRVCRILHAEHYLSQKTG